MRFFRNRLQKVEDLINAKDIEKAIGKLNRFHATAHSSRSKLENLMRDIDIFNKNIDAVIYPLKDGKRAAALAELSGLKKKLKQIETQIVLLAGEIEELK